MGEPASTDPAGRRAGVLPAACHDRRVPIMPQLSVTVRARGAAPPAEVWDRYVRPERWASWSPQIRSVQVPAAVLTPGLRGTVHGPAGLRVSFVVEDVDAGAGQWSWRVHAGPVSLRLAHRVWARPTGTATSLLLHGPAPVVLGYLPVARLALHRLVQP